MGARPCARGRPLRQPGHRAHGHQREHVRARVPKRVDEPRLVGLAERGLVDGSDGVDVAGRLGADAHAQFTGTARSRRPGDSGPLVASHLP